MNVLRRLSLRRAAKQYARRLGPHLHRAYGTAEHYTPAQIRSAATKLRLDSRYIALGYAGFMPEDEYASMAPQAPFAIPYGDACELIARFRPAGRFGAADYYESGIGMTGGLDGGSP